MSCNCCCTKILRLCKIPVCGESEIDFGITAAVAGIHIMVFDFLGVQFTVEKEFDVDEQITFPTTDLNEDYTYHMKLVEPDGKQVIIRKDEIDYDCFEVKTIISYAVNSVA